jgi:hypothetical protein
MPYYSRPIGTEYPPVAFAFNSPSSQAYFKRNWVPRELSSRTSISLPITYYLGKHYQHGHGASNTTANWNGLKASWMQAVTNSVARSVPSSWYSSWRRAKSPWTVSRVNKPMAKPADVYLPNDH